MSVQDREAEAGRLRRGTLSIWEAVGISLALMAPSMAANINPQGSAATVGRAVPLTFVIATVGVLLVAYGIIRLCQHLHHAGSAYALVGVTLGPRAGVVAGWTLLGTYTAYCVVTVMATGIFGSDVLRIIGVWDTTPTNAPWIIALIALVGVLVLASTPVRSATRFLLTAEVATVALILIVSVIVFIRVAVGNTPNNVDFTLDMFTVPSGVGASTLFLGVVFGFLSFAGFEAAASLGEETRQPRRAIPLAILAVVVFGGVYFTFVTFIEMLGFGTDAAGLEAFTSSQSLLGDLGSLYVATWVGDLITVGVTISAFACALACMVGASRLLFALGRDGFTPGNVGGVNSRTGAPIAASAIVAIVAAAAIIIVRLAWTSVAFNLFFWAGTVGTLALLVAYLLVTLGAIRFLFLGDRETGVAKWEVIIPLAAVVVVLYTLYRNVWPVPDGTAKYFPYIVAGWIIIGLIAILARPAVARRIGERLAAAEGLTAAGETPAGREQVGTTA